jgi:protease IV
MKQFFKFFLASCLGFLVSFIALGAIGVWIISAVATSAVNDEPNVDVDDNSILYLTLNNAIVDHTASEGLPSVLGGSSAIGLDDILASIKYAKTDDRIKGIFIEASSLNTGMATVEELRNSLLDFKTSGKFIIAYSDYYSQGGYYLSSIADKIYVNPMGGVEFKGLSAELVFIKGTLEKLGVEPQIIRHGKFKSAIEPLINDKMSESNRLQTRTYIGALWNKILEGVSKSRNISVADLQTIANGLLLTDAKAALDKKFVDGVKYKDEVLDMLKEKTGSESINKINFINLNNYVKVNRPSVGDRNKKVAVIFAEGSIVDGKGSDGDIGSVTLSRQLRSARLDDKIKAVVLRINSPGGSALASDVIWREVLLLKKVKPVIVSMGNVAASGGYYIACAADTIVAQPNTITGSIGVFGVLWNAKGLTDKLGVSVDTVKTGAMADLGTASRAMTEPERKYIQNQIEMIYDVFIGKVADGRKMTKADVDSIGQGRVWSGVDAKRIGLVDVLGGMDVAINIAAKKAKLEDFSVVFLPRPEKGLTKFFKDLSGDEDDKVSKIMAKELGSDYKYYQYLKNARQIQGIQARMPYEIEIH